ncbi:MAG: S-methyl-5-thioribose-1-phosphate isomerase [Candidatus Thermoplasmatota archaeon]|nr:S-methyl-5-thioribose-1-phosphate isomerase [Candidatus Thermoplasmatota archaeon]
MKVEGKELRALWFEDDKVKFIDQRKLPYNLKIYTAETVDDIAFAIKDMVVRGAPAIGAAAVYGMVLGKKEMRKTAKRLRQTRPTANDLFYAIDYIENEFKKGENPLDAANRYVEDIINRCKKIGENGEKLIKDGMNILTHCNAGALATVDYGTALAPIRLAYKNGKNIFIYADETRPRCQGLLTSWELKNEGIKHSVIVDNAAGHFMKNGEVDMVIVGADRIAKNGDFANKIGTYEKAVIAKENSIPFYVAAPVSTFDNAIETGSRIIIEERKREELSKINGKTIMPDWAEVKNPAFDVTPKKYVTGYITEGGIKKY